MDKNKMYWIGGGIAAAGIVAYMVYSSKNTGLTSTTSTTLTPGVCPAGQVPCANNRSKCYNPSVNYVVDPCGGATAASGNDPIVQIVSGIIGLFKKKQATPAQAPAPAAYPAV